MRLSLVAFFANSAGLTFTLRTAEVSTPEKYLAAMIGLSPICRENMPIGSLAKLTSTEKLNCELGMYEEIIEMADESPLVNLPTNTSLQLFLQSLADEIKACGR